MTAAERLDIHLNSDNWFRRSGSTSGPFYYCGVRLPFKTENGITISIQQSDIHWCGIGSVELYNCPWHELLDPYGVDGDPYSHVPLGVVAKYIEALEVV
jgi:hypothetical protein